jgi:hypothetical protein
MAACPYVWESGNGCILAIYSKVVQELKKGPTGCVDGRPNRKPNVETLRQTSFHATEVDESHNGGSTQNRKFGKPSMNLQRGYIVFA